MIGLTLSKPSTKLPTLLLKSNVWKLSYILNILKKNSLFTELIALCHHFSQPKPQLSWLPEIYFKGIVGQTCSESLQSWGIGWAASSLREGLTKPALQFVCWHGSFPVSFKQSLTDQTSNIFTASDSELLVPLYFWQALNIQVVSWDTPDLAFSQLIPLCHLSLMEPVTSVQLQLPT